MSTPFDDETESVDSPDAETAPAPGGPNDPGASASDENQADTPGYSGGGDADPTLADDPEGSLLDDPASENQFGDNPQELQGEDPASGGS